MKTNTVYDSFGHRYSISPHKILMCCTTATILLFRLPEGFPPPTGRVHSARPREIQHMPPSLGLYNSCNEPGFSGCGLLFPFVRVCVYFINFYWSIVALQRCVSAVQQSESAIRINISRYLFPLASPSLPPSLSHPSRWSQSIELISLWYAAASH